MRDTRIRPAGPLDLFLLSASPEVSVRLDLVQQLLFSHHPLREAISSWLGLQGATSTLLCLGKSGLLACVQAHAVPRTHSWDVDYLAMWAGVAAARPALWEDLLVRLAVEAGRRETIRLLARLSDEEYLDPFQRTGFVPFAEEILLRWGETDPDGVERKPELRPLEEADLWGVHQLYIGLTPPRVQQAEGLTIDSWRLERGEEGWAWMDEQRAQAYLRRRQGPRGVVLEVLLDPACRQAGAAVVARGLAGHRRPTYLLLRSYQGELLDVARRLGFRLYAKQVLLVKQLAVSAEQRQPLASRATEPKLGAAPTTPSVGNA